MRRFVALALAACSAPAQAPAHKAAPAPTQVRDDDLARLPDNTWAVGAVDLVQLRTSLARRWVWQVAGDESALVSRCRDELAAGTRATVALAGDGDDTLFAIVHGVDRAAIARCAVTAAPTVHDVAAANVPCDGYDAAVHALNGCPVPMTSVPAVVKAEAQLRSDGVAACPAAAQAIAAVVAHRTELGWRCPRDEDRRSTRVDKPGVAKGGAIDFGDREHVEFLDDHTVLITQASRGATRAAWPALARHPRWFESTAGAIDRARGIWAVANLERVLKVPAAFAISAGIRGDFVADIQISGAPSSLTNEIDSIAAHAVEDKDFAGLKVALGCAPSITPPRTPKLLACEAAEQHIGDRLPDRDAIDYGGLLAERAARCAADNWPDDYVACIGKAVDEHAFAACENLVSEADREKLQRATACGDRAVAVHIAFPDARIEALKLSNAASHVERDCSDRKDGEVTAHFFGDNDGHYVVGCAGDQCNTFDLANGQLVRDRSAIATADCIGPIHRDPGGWTDAQRRCDGGAWFKPGMPKDATAISADGKRALAIAKGTVQVWDASANKPLGKLALGKGCTTATFLGDLVAVGCGAQSYLATPSGAKLATLGDVILSPLPLPDRTWALVSRSGDRIDLYTGAGKKQTELAVPHHAEVVDAAVDSTGTIAIAYGGTGPDAGAVAVIDAKQQLRFWQLPACPALPADH